MLYHARKVKKNKIEKQLKKLKLKKYNIEYKLKQLKLEEEKLKALL